jgi:hypothetical protein
LVRDQQGADRSAFASAASADDSLDVGLKMGL